MPGIEAGLLDRGYQRRDHRWYRAISMGEYLSGSAEPPVSNFYVPYLVHYRSSGQNRYLAFLGGLISFSRPRRQLWKLSLLYDQLFSLSAYPGGKNVSILPRIFDLPLFMRYNGGESQLEFLLFFHLNFKS